jgi:TonB family protein
MYSLKSTLVKNLAVSVFLFFGMIFAQDSYQRRYDRLKKNYDDKIGEWKEYERYLCRDGITKSEYNKLLPIYYQLWKAAQKFKKELLYFQGDSLEADKINYNVSTPLPAMIEIFYDTQDTCLSTNGIDEKFDLVSDYNFKIYEFIRLYYPELAKEKNISGKVMIGFTLNAKGYQENVHILSEEPDKMNFGTVAVEAVKLLRINSNIKNNISLPVNLKMPIIFKPEYKDTKCDSLKKLYYAELKRWENASKEMSTDYEIQRSKVIELKNQYIQERNFDKIIDSGRKNTNKNLEVFIDFFEYNLLPEDILALDNYESKTIIENYPPLIYVTGISGYAIIGVKLISDINGEKKLQVQLEDEYPKDLGIGEVALKPFWRENEQKIIEIISINKSEDINFKQMIYFISSSSKRMKTITVTR